MDASGENLLPRSFPGGVLRRLRADELRAFQSYRNIPELGRFQGWTPLSDDEALAFVTTMRSAPFFAGGQWVQLAIADPTGQTLVGDIGLCLAADGRSGEVGFTLSPTAQGCGVATRAVSAAAHLFFDATHATRLVGVTDERNVRSIRLLERLGFQAIDQRSARFRGEECLELVYVLERDAR